MAGPWEDFQNTPGPWSDFQTAPEAPATAHAHAPEDKNKKAARAWIEAHPDQREGAQGYARMLLNGATFGFGDNAMAGMGALHDYLQNGGSIQDLYAQNKARQDVLTEEARKNTGMVGTGLEFAGSVLPTMGVGGVATKVLGAGLKGSLATGATAGALQSAGDDQDPTVGAVLGGVGGGVGHGLVSGVSKLAGLANKQPFVPELDAIKQRADAARNRFTNSPVRYSESGIQDLGDTVNNILSAENYDAIYHGNLARSGAIEMLNNLKYGRAVPSLGAAKARTPMDLHRIEQQLAKVAGRGGEDARLAQILRDEVGDFMRNASSFDTITGNSARARAALETSNRNYTKFYKDKAVQDAVETAAERAAKTASGGNRENTLRQEIDKLINKRGDWTADEQEALKKVVFGAPGQNVTRLLGKMSPEGNGLAMMLHLMSAPFAGSYTLPAGALGFGAKRISEAQTRRHVADLSKIIRAGGDKTKAFAQPNKVQKALTKNRATVAGLLGTGGELY